MQWLLDKVMCRFQRHEAPLVLVPKLGESQIAWLFQGILSNKRCQPVVVDWFAVRGGKKNSLTTCSLEDLLSQSGFGGPVPNTGRESVLAEAAGAQLVQVVQVARDYILGMSTERTADLRQRMDDDNARFGQWVRRRQKQIIEYRERHRIEGSNRLPRDKEERAKRMKDDMDHRQEQRLKWLKETYEVAGAPYLKLAAVFVGE